MSLYFICALSAQDLSNNGKQSRISDSIHHLVKVDRADTNKLIHLCALSLEYLSLGNYEDGVKFANKAIVDADILLAQQQLSEVVKFTINGYKAKANTVIATIYRNQNMYGNAINYFSKALAVRESMGDKKGMAGCYNGIGMIYSDQGNYVEALKNYLLSLKIKEAIGDKKGIANCYNNIGLVYYDQHNYKEAIKNHLAALKIRKEINDAQGIAYSYNNIGNVYFELKDYPAALISHKASLKIMEESGDQNGVANSYNNVAAVYFEQGLYENNVSIKNEKFDQALTNFKAALSIREMTLDNQGIAMCYGNIAAVLAKQKKLNEAKIYFEKAKNFAKNIGEKEILRETYHGLAELDSVLGNFKGAYINHLLYISYRDSLDNEESRKQTIQNQMTYDFEKKEAIAATEHKKELEHQQQLAKERNRKQYAIIIATVIGLFVVLIFSGFILRSLRLTRKQKSIIELQKNEVEAQKHLVEEKQKEIIDSITYAKRLQKAILPSDEELKKYLPDNFVLYQPKDIVAGDFYWLHVSGDFVFIAAADSTGHGVPGAMVSVVCSNALNRAVDEFKLTDTGKILDKTRKLVLETFAKSGEEIKDGMDISLLCINRTIKQITWSAANNQLWFISPFEGGVRRTGDVVLREIKANKQAIGKTDNPLPFTTHHIELNKGDIFYLMTDGFADQFGGPRGKKFKYKALAEKLSSIGHLNITEQKQELQSSFQEWKGELEQVDDVTIIGIRI
ncbi:MAG: tetratricopeptide repeat protein [Burkholderiales bacterium]|nr:tetratricopeptide repeat protein [Bacteroidia bacterium]